MEAGSDTSGRRRLVGPPAARPARALVADGAGRRAQARLVLSLGPATVAVGLVWALLQPYRITLLDPRGESFWWLAVQPPLLVVVAGVVFHLAVARGLVRDLAGSDR
jgi:hypothetical protein